MSYNFGFAKQGFELLSDGTPWPEYRSYIYWDISGWRHTEMHDAFAALATEKILDEESSDKYCKCYWYVIPVERLAFLRKLADQVEAQTIMKVIDGLYMLGEEYAFSFVESLPEGAQAALRLIFSLDDATPEEQDICSLILDDFECGYMHVAESLGEAYDKMVEDGAESVLLWA